MWFLQDLEERIIPPYSFTCGYLNRIYVMVLSKHFAFTAVDEGFVKSSFLPTILGETQAPRGKWHPHMTGRGLIPHLDDVIAALDTAVSRDIRDL
jgi:hypothetical protein